jgi:hypothetical protein
MLLDGAPSWRQGRWPQTGDRFGRVIPPGRVMARPSYCVESAAGRHLYAAKRVDSRSKHGPPGERSPAGQGFQSHLDPVVEDSFVHGKGAATSVTKAALGLGRGSIAR